MIYLFKLILTGDNNMKKQICKLFKDVLRVSPEIQDQRPCHNPEFLRKQSPYTVIKHNPYKFLKQVYKKLNIHEKKMFIQALYLRMQEKALEQINQEDSNGN